MTAPWLTLIGLGEDGHLTPAALEKLKACHVVYGSQRHFDLIGGIAAETRLWPSPFASVFDDMTALRGRPVGVLASGDPQWYGIGASLSRRFSAREMDVLPAPSAFQLAAARMGWPLQDCDTLSLHGRPVDLLRAALYPGAKIIALTSNAETPRQVADILADEGFGASRMTVLEHMGGERERIVSGTAEAWHHEVAEFHTLALEVTGSHFRPRIPGLPDDAFRHDGKMTKREVRSMTLAALMPHAGATLWDIGAGCGSIGIEWMRAARGATAIGLEPDAGRRALAASNAAALGVPGLKLMDAKAPDGLEGLPQPDAIFIGGGLTAPNQIETSLEALSPGGRLVANAVTLEGEAVLSAAFATLGGDLTRLSVSRASAVGTLTGWRPLMPVTQWSLIKS